MGVFCLLTTAVVACKSNTTGTSSSGSNATGGSNAGTSGSSGTTSGIKTITALHISPQDPVLTVDGTTPANQVFTITADYSDGSSADVSGQASFDLDSDQLGAFNGHTFTSTTYGGTVTAIAHVAGQSATTKITVKVQVAYKDPGAGSLPPDAGGAFSGTQVTGVDLAPDIVYPNEGVLLPPNLSRLEIHFTPGTNNKLFEVSFSNSVTDLKIYTRCTNPVGAGCIYQPDSTVWRWLSETNRGGDPVQIGVRGVNDSVSGAQVGVSAKVSISFAHDNVNGAIYYWTTTNSQGIMRVSFGIADAGPTPYAGTSLTGGTCVGCHALSRDGTKLVAELGGQNDGRLLMLDVSKNQTLNTVGSNDDSIFESWNPAATQFVGAYGDTGATDYNLHIQDGATGKTVKAIAGTGDASHPADHPDWAPTGDKIVYTRVGVKNTLQRMGLGAIQMVTTPDGGAWTAPVTLVPQANGKNHYYPAFSPDGKFIVYDESTCPAGTSNGTYVKDCDADTDPSAKLFAITLTGSGSPVALTKANAPGKADGSATDLTNSFPKWSPFINKGKAPGSRLMWITFASTRKFGLRTPPAGGEENPSGTWLWMAAVDPDKVSQGVDPSYPAFYLPYQELGTSNHIAQWAETLVDHCDARNAVCTKDTDCCSGLFCYRTEISGTCQPQGTCANTTQACGGSVSCCDGLKCQQSDGSACTNGASCSCAPIFK